MMTTRKMKSTSQKQPRNGFVVMGRLIGLVRPLMGFMVLAILMGLAGNLCATFIPIFGGYALLRVLGVETFLPLGGLFAAVLIFALVRGGLWYAEQSCNHYIAFRLLAIIRDKVFQALRKLCPAKLEGRDRGDLISVITSDIELLEVFYAHTISPVAIALLFTVVMLVFLGACHWAYALLALCAYLTVGIVVPLIAAKGSGDTGLQFRTASGDLSSHVLDTLRGLDEILQFNAGEARLEEMIRKTEDLSRLESRMKFAAGLNSAATGLVILLFDVAALVLGVSLHLSGAVSFQNVLVPVLALFSSFGPCTALAALGTTLQQTLAAGNRVLDILEETPAVSEITGQKEVSFQGARLDHVSFSYGADAASSSGGSNGGSNGSSSRDSGSSGTSADSSAEKSGCSSNAVLPVLQDLTLEIPQGKIIGIVGRSGSGKSTILKLLMRFWTVQEGRVSVSGTDVNQINTANLRNLEGFVTQDTHLFRDSIRNNVRIAKLDATDEEIEEACRKASVHDFILSLPQGYDTPVGELGDTLSGGERQRIGLARAFLHDAPLMLLDEPTSNLDSLNEAVILRSLHQQRQDRTVVLVSHRQSTMKIADQTISIENGRMS